MNDLDIVKNERIRIQGEYLTEVEQVWRSERLEAVEKDKQARKLYKAYQSKDKFLENLEARLESCLADIEYYNSKNNKK